MTGRRIIVTGGSGFIGTYLIGELVRDGAEVLNLDVRPAQVDQGGYRACDVTDPAAVDAAFGDFRADAVVHLAARTDTDSDAVEDYSVNWEGTRLTAAAAARTGVRRYVSTSTQYVHALTSTPVDNADYSPFTAYGESKVRSEQVTREGLDGTDVQYVIIRPTNIWGPRHPRYPEEFWRVLRRGLYVHPKVTPPIERAYGYVGTVTWQIRRLLDLPDDRFPAGGVFYVGDPLLRLDDWVDGFSRALRGRPARRIDRRVIVGLGRAGDVLKRAGLPSPLTSSRVHNMISSSAAPMSPITELLGPSPWTLDAGVTETVDWLRTSGR